jgi:hypothetical protein
MAFSSRGGHLYEKMHPYTLGIHSGSLLIDTRR